MLRAILFLAVAVAAMAQRPDPVHLLDTALQAAWKAIGDGRFEEIAAKREQARILLRSVPADSPRFIAWVMQVSQLFQNSGWNARSRGVLQEALDRTLLLGDSHPARIGLLAALGESWRQDGNLQKAVLYWEQAVAAQTASGADGTAQTRASGYVIANRASFRSAGAGFGSGVDVYERLADLYHQLGRPDALADVAAKIRALARNDASVMARFYEQHGPLEEAAALYQKAAEQSADPQAQVNAWQGLAGYFARQQRYTEAVAAMEKGIVASRSSGQPGQAPWLHENLATYLRQAGMLDQANQLFEKILRESRGSPQETQALSAYAMHLVETKRGDQAESLLSDYLQGGSNLDVQQRTSILFTLSNVARARGDSAHAEEYQQAGMALQPEPPPLAAGQTHIADDLAKARAALEERRLEEAYLLTLRAIDAAPRADDGQQVEWLVPLVAEALAADGEPTKADRLFQSLIALAQDWSADRMEPLITTTRNYAHFLIDQRDRAGDVAGAIERLRRALVEANGPESGSLTEVIRLKLEFASRQSEWSLVDSSVRELLESQESLSGNTSGPYLGDLVAAAQLYQASGKSARALPLLRKAIAVADLVATPNDGSPSETRMDAALALARLGEFDEAERLGEEAILRQRTLSTPRPPMEQQLEMIRRMRNAAALHR